MSEIIGKFYRLLKTLSLKRNEPPLICGCLVTLQTTIATMVETLDSFATFRNYEFLFLGNSSKDYAVTPYALFLNIIQSFDKMKHIVIQNFPGRRFVSVYF